MSYDFFVFPAALADDQAASLASPEASPGRGVLTPDGPVARFVEAANEASPAGSEDGFLVGPVEGDDVAAYVRTGEDRPMSHLHTVASLAAPLGLSVLDVQLDALYDPRNAAEVLVRTEGGPELPFLSRAVLRDVLADIAALRYHWLHVSRDEDHYVQSFRDDDGSWAVEHRDGSPDEHFVTRTADADLVEALLWSWTRNDGRWQAMISFAPVEL